MRIDRASVLSLMPALLLSVVVEADDDVSASEWFVPMLLTSDYVDRGVSQSDGHAAVQGEVG